MELYSIKFSISALSPHIIMFLRLFCLAIVIPFYGWEVSHCRSVCHNSFIQFSEHVWVILKTWEGLSHPVKLHGDIIESKTAHLILVIEPQGQVLHMVNSTRLFFLLLLFSRLSLDWWLTHLSAHFGPAHGISLIDLGLLCGNGTQTTKHLGIIFLKSVWEGLYYEGLCDVDFCSSGVFFPFIFLAS